MRPDEPVWRWWTRRGTVDEHADVSGGGDVRDDELEDPQGCIDPWTGDIPAEFQDDRWLHSQA